MNVLVIGSGGREHALVWKIRQSPHVRKLYCAPGNPGIAEIADCAPIRPTALGELRDFAWNNRIDLTVVGPEQPLADGIADFFAERGLKVFGPTSSAAELEWSKAFAKEFMQKYRIPTAQYRVFERDRLEDARAYVERAPLPVVIKADGLAAGKGVAVCNDQTEALAVLATMDKKFGPASDRIVIEEYLEGEEASVFAITDGEHFLTLAPAQDHKRIFDEDRGKNTGGMGAYAPAPIVTRDLLKSIERDIIEPTLRGMREEGRRYRGCLYVGLMITSEGPRVVEYNCRLGDPEAQVVLPLYRGDIVELFDAAASDAMGTLPRQHSHADEAAVCVVLASGGYPDEYATGIEISGLEELEGMDGIIVFHAGTRLQDNTLVTAGGRVLGVTAVRPHLAEAIRDVYEAVSKISFAGMHYRRDIGRKAFVH
ncbi:MAG TPA: phosphoribosylamine--glycine ligase [Bacteroidota bacterium]|nr:phosphoribosylamine--glycine ligase [Bacteroidota bacterium]